MGQDTSRRGEIESARTIDAAINPKGFLPVGIAFVKRHGTIGINFTGIILGALFTTFVPGVIDSDYGASAI